MAPLAGPCRRSSATTVRPRLSTVTGQPRTRASVVYDPTSRETLIVGGFSDAAMSGTWILGEATVADDGPSARASAAVAYDISRDVIVLFGGRSPECAGSFNACDTTLEMVPVP